MRRTLRTLPTLLRIGLAEAFAYRAEFVVWMLTTTMPLVMLALWTAVAREGPLGRFGQAEFVSYYLAALIVRTLTSSWVVWEMNQDIRMGTLSLRLLRPIHPFLAYGASHIAQIPLRGIVAVPFATILLIVTGGSQLVSDPLTLALLPLILLSSWLITFFAGAALGSLGMLIERSTAAWEIWMGMFAILSGYLVPLELMPGWLAAVADWMPFRYMLGFPVETIIGMNDRAAVLRGLAAQWAMIVVLASIALGVWRAGLRRFEAFGA